MTRRVLWGSPVSLGRCPCMSAPFFCPPASASTQLLSLRRRVVAMEKARSRRARSLEHGDLPTKLRTIDSGAGSAAETIEAGREHVSPVVPSMAFSCHPWFMIYGRDPRAISTPLPQCSAHSPPSFSSSAPPCPALSAACPSLRAKPPFALVQFPQALSTTTSESI